MSEFWIDRPTLVTGATGLVGSWLVGRLVAAGASAVCIVRDWVPESELFRSEVFRRVTVVRGDVCDGDLLGRVLAEYEIDTVFHLAAQTIVPIASRNPAGTCETNIAGTWRLLDACRRIPVEKQIVVASSDKAYGSQKTLPYTEDLPLEGQNPYDVSKVCADLLARSWSRTYGLPVAVTRCGNIFGGGDLNWNRIVPGTIRAALRGQRPVIRSDGRPVRDYFYVEDAAAAYLQLAERIAADPGVRGEAFNFSNETPLTVLEMVARILEVMGSSAEPEVRNDATGEIQEQYLSAAKARRQLGWSPLYTLDEAIEHTVSWYRAFLEVASTG